MARHDIIAGVQQFRIPLFLLPFDSNYVGRHRVKPGHWCWQMREVWPSLKPFDFIGFRLNAERAA